MLEIENSKGEEMAGNYLWDGSGQPDFEVQRLGKMLESVSGSLASLQQRRSPFYGREVSSSDEVCLILMAMCLHGTWRALRALHRSELDSSPRNTETQSCESVRRSKQTRLLARAFPMKIWGK